MQGMGGAPMGGPGAGAAAGAGRKPRPGQIPNLFESNKGIFFVANQGYKLFYIIRKFVNNSMFFGGWVALFFMFPMVICYSEE